MWWKCVLPQWLPKLRLPIFAVLAYGISVVDVALIVGPTNPPTFAVLVWQWFSDADLSLLPRACAGAVVLFFVALLLIALMRGIEWFIVSGIKCWQYSGRRGIQLPGLTSALILVSIGGVMLPLMSLWSVAQRWRYPDFLPTRYSLRFWQHEWASILSTIEQSVLIALLSASIALIFSIIVHEYRIKYRWKIPSYFMLLPMFIPQLSLLFGLQIITLIVDGSMYWWWVCWSHMFFAFPFIYLSLDGPWKSYDLRFTQAALSLGKSPCFAFTRVKLPILFPAIMYAWAIGISVSFAQYLPTLILGAGRVITLTTEAVALTSGSDRRVIAIYGLWQGILPLVFFWVALTLGRLSPMYRRQRSQKG
jgi:putative thiamine transport system permease protein